jgi:hypothetical protein
MHEHFLKECKRRAKKFEYLHLVSDASMREGINFMK